MRRTKSYTSSGIKNKTPRFNRGNYRFLKGFEEQFLFSRRAFTNLCPLKQILIQEEAQTMFFSWMEQKWSVKQITSHYAKRLMYADIVEILFAKSKKREIFGFLSRGSAPAFHDFQDVGGEEVKDGMTPSPFFEFHHSGLGVIPSLSSSPSITLSVPALYSRSLVCVHEASVSMPMQFPFLESFDSLMFPSESLVIPSISITFPPIRHFEKDVIMGDSRMGSMSELPKESFLEILANADVSETLRKISETQAQISLVFNQDLDALLGPCDYIKQM